MNSFSKKYDFLTSKEIKPAGWLKSQLEIQAQGLAGNLDKVWRDVRDSMWIGGDAEGWERVPYWLDGFIPLAFLLENEDMITRAERYIDKIIEQQQPDGWICPNGNTPREQYDTWAIQLITKVLTVWYDCSGDNRIPKVIYDALKNYYDLLSNGAVKLFGWGKARWFETFVAINFIKKKYNGEPWIIELAHILKNQGTDYNLYRENWKEFRREWTFETHIVNLAMMLKYEAICSDVLGDEYTHIADELFDILNDYNGKPAGVFNGDECLSGTSPIQGTELCAVVEQIYSYEWLYAVTGENIWAERLEKAAFNALPATISEDMWVHQYDQMSNQIECTPFTGDSVFGTNTCDAHIFGLEPNYGCCTADHGQGWPKLAISSWMKTENGFISAIPVPAVLNTNFKGVKINIALSTDYPFKNQFTYKITASEKCDMTLSVRIPSFAENIIINGNPAEKREVLEFNGFSQKETVITISFDTIPCLKKSKCNMYYVEKGSLIFSLPIESTWEIKEYTLGGVERKFPYCDYYIKGSGDFNYGFNTETISYKTHSVSEIPFSESKPPITLDIKMSHIDWEFRDEATNCAKPYPNSAKPLDKAVIKKFIPYGCTTLRMTEMPICERE